MDERPAALLSPRDPHHSPGDHYHCPGELHAIDRATHLGRLGSFFPGCRHCTHKHDTGGLASIEVRHWSELNGRPSLAPQFAPECFEGTAAAGLDVGAVHQVAAALGIVLWREESPRRVAPQVVVGCDGHWSTAELLASACTALQWTGCRSVEVGAVTSPALACLAARRQADGALWIGNASGVPQSIALKAWGHAGSPWSSPGTLDALATVWQSTSLDRPRRTGGGAERGSARDVYLPTLAPLFHALRPLRLVLDSTCQPLLRSWQELSRTSACELISTGQAPTAQAAGDGSLVERRLAVVAQRVVSNRAHFGIWIDGDGETCRLVDEHGRAVASEKLLLALAAFICRRDSGVRVLVERDASEDCQRALEAIGAHTLRSDASRQAMFHGFVEHGAALAGGPSGRFWFGSCPPAPDALLTLCFWLSILSQSDRPVSEVLDGAAAAEYN